MTTVRLVRLVVMQCFKSLLLFLSGSMFTVQLKTVYLTPAANDGLQEIDDFVPTINTE